MSDMKEIPLTKGKNRGSNTRQLVSSKATLTGCGDYICDDCKKRCWFTAPHTCETVKIKEQPDDSTIDQLVVSRIATWLWQKCNPELPRTAGDIAKAAIAAMEDFRSEVPLLTTDLKYMLIDAWRQGNAGAIESLDNEEYADIALKVFSEYETAKVAEHPDVRDTNVVSIEKNEENCGSNTRQLVSVHPDIKTALECAERLADDKGSDLQYELIAKGIAAMAGGGVPTAHSGQVDNPPPSQQPVEYAAIIKTVREVIKRRAVEDNSDLYGVIKMLKELSPLPSGNRVNVQNR